MKLTRSLVLSRAKASDLESIKKFNCWGCNLTDISIFTEMPNVEVLTLSANNISNLEHIASCQNLSELYLRRNNIKSLSELSHLKNLTCLKVLWLAENPCCGVDPIKYRLTVLRNLPGLQKLDNQVVTEEELALALEDREEAVTPPGPATASSSNGLEDAESEYDHLNYSMEETDKNPAHLGMKPVSGDKFSPSRESVTSLKKKSHTLEAVLLLLKDLDVEELKTVQCATENKLRARSRQKEKKTIIQH
ncbi:cilia and flagella associated protein 410 isoform X2 [Tachysurus fulvidraco]|uniref:cilia and flagella associated protein 410 isoform X2 n=1 Tax=Tachysurus fulvidraco TaxID=1234273 RepID=UPI000F509B91|nr:cilia and flagella associated protein 410 isoform X2 [Tachysurus fulvidraco]